MQVGDFAAYAVVVVSALSALSFVSLIVRKLNGGRGLSDRRALGGGADPEHVAQLAAEVEALRDEVAGLRRQVDEQAERQDFTERVLAQARERGALPPPRERLHTTPV